MSIKLSRIGGFSFKGLTVDNTDDIYLLDVDKDTTPTLRYTEFIVPRRHGSSRYDDSYASREIAVVIGVYADTVQERKVKIRKLIAPMIGKEGKLIFNDEPNLFFNAKIYSAIPTVETDIFTELTIIFNADPFMYELYTYIESLHDNNLIEDADGVLINKTEVTTKVATTKQISNKGNFEAMPLIILDGSATKVTVTIGDYALAYNGLVNEKVYIDTEKMIVYTDNGVKKVSKLTNFNGKFPIIPVGLSEVKINGTGLNLSVEIKYRNTYTV